MRTPLTMALMLIVAGCASFDPEAPLGSAANPVRAHGFRGEFEYFSTLRCPDGTRPHVQGLQHRPPGPQGRGLSVYRARCIYLNAEYEIHFDRFHPQYLETEPVAGFTLARTSALNPPFRPSR